MFLRCRVSCFSVLLPALLLSALVAPASAGQELTGARKALTVERIYSQPSLSGRLTRGLTWTPDGKQVSYFETKGSGRDAKTELWAMDAASGERRLLVAADKLEAILPADISRPTQATGLGRRAPSQYQWAPDGTGILLQSPTALAWLDVKSQTGRTLVSGKATLVDPKISPDGRNVSFVRDHNVWLVNLADGKERTITRGGTEEIRKGNSTGSTRKSWISRRRIGGRRILPRSLISKWMNAKFRNIPWSIFLRLAGKPRWSVIRSLAARIPSCVFWWPR